MTLPIVLIPLKEDSLSIKDKTAEFILSPMCPLFRGSTVYSVYALHSVIIVFAWLSIDHICVFVNMQLLWLE